MAEQVTHNCHYVSRLVTKPWEGEQRFLHVYDFDEDRFYRRPSRRMFAEEDLNSPQTEAWLNEYVETPLASIRQQVAYGDVRALESDWKRFRAANLMLWLQGIRGRSVQDYDARRRLDVLATTPEPEIDWLVNDLGKSFDLRLVRTHSNGHGIAMLYVPSTGLFPIVIRDRGCRSGRTFGLALPIHVNCALVLTPTERGGAVDVSPVPQLLQQFSIGMSRARRIVVPPELLAKVGEQKARADILQLRAANDKLVALVHEVRDLHLMASRVCGIELALDDAGRIPRNVSL